MDDVGKENIVVQQAPNHASDESITLEPKKGSRLRRLLWDSLDKSPEERRFVNKADWYIMSYVCVAYFVKYLDQNNVRSKKRKP